MNCLSASREIRASERRFYLKITDIYEQCSIDYNKDAEVTRTFFKTVQNKLHWAATRQTAAEMIKARADATKPNMGLQTWKNAPRARFSNRMCQSRRTNIGRGNHRTQSHRDHVSRLRGRPRRPANPDAHGRLVAKLDAF